MIILTDVVNKALEVSPWNAAAYGVLVALLMVAVGALWKKVQKQDEQYESLAKEATSKLAEVNVYLSRDEVGKQLDKIESKLDELRPK